MIRRFALSTLFLFALLAAPFGAAAQGPPVEFEELTMIFELNETDGDAEVVMFAQAPEGMTQLTVFGPKGAKRIDLRARGGRDDVGQAEVLLESAEPSVGAVKKAFPEGEYTFMARTVTGQRVAGVVTLSHALLPAPSFSPQEEEVDPDHVVVSWSPVPGAAAYQVEIEQDEIGANLTVTVGPDVSSLEIPPGFLEPGTEYEIGVATITPGGNVAVAESSFTTTD